MTSDEHEHLQRLIVVQVAGRLNLGDETEDESQLLRRIESEEPAVKHALDAFRTAYRNWFGLSERLVEHAGGKDDLERLSQAVRERDLRQEDLLAELEQVAWKHRPVSRNSRERLQAAGILDDDGNLIDPYRA